jgi:FkbM family methyltransferase
MLEKLATRLGRKQPASNGRLMEFGPFVLSRPVVCGFELTLLTHNEDKVLSEWIRGGRAWSAQDKTEYGCAVAYSRGARVIVDVGSNLGLVSLLMAKSAPDSVIYAFEPDALNFSLSQINFELNECRHVVATNAAVSDFDGQIELRRSRRNWGDHRTYFDRAGATDPSLEEDSRKVPAIRPETFFSGMLDSAGETDIDLLKIDTQGSDIKILAAFAPLLKRGTKVLVEFSPYHLMSCGTDAADVRECLGSAGRIEVIDPIEQKPGGWAARQTQIGEIVEYFRSGAQGYAAVGYRDLIVTW